jgi:hypothetical protein
VERTVDPDDLDQRREVVPEAPHGIDAKTTAHERIRLDEDERRGQQRRAPCTQGRKDVRRPGVVVVARIEEGEQCRRVDEGEAQSSASSRYASCRVEMSRAPRRSR